MTPATHYTYILASKRRGAMFVGNTLALVRPRQAPREDGELVRAPLGRSIVMAVVGLMAAIWAIATLTS